MKIRTLCIIAAVIALAVIGVFVLKPAKRECVVQCRPGIRVVWDRGIAAIPDKVCRCVEGQR